MALIDGDGRLFGRVNVIDACVAALVTALLAMTPFVYRAFRTRPVTVTAVLPHKLTIGEPMRVQVKGEQFRPYLQAFAGRRGERFMLDEVDRSRFQATYLLVSPELAELQFPDEIGTGTFDLNIADRGRVVAVIPSAFTVTQPDRAVAVRPMKVQFYPPPEAVSLIRVGDRDFSEPRLPTSPVSEPATVVAVEPRPERRELIDMHLTAKGDTWYGQPMIGQLVEVTLRVPQSQMGPESWVYNEEGIRVGGLFTLTTDRYRLRGIVTWVGDLEPTPSAGPAK
jgi:hypothetical protein